MNWRRWLIVGYLLIMMWLSFSIVTIPGERYQILTTSDSGWVYDEAKIIENTNAFAENNIWSHAPYGLNFEVQQLQPLMAVMIYRGVHTVVPSVSLMDVVKYYGPLLFCLSLIPIYLIAREFAGDIGGIIAVFFMATMVSTIYWHKIGAFDREPTITLLSAWSFYLLVKLFKSNRRTLPIFSLLAAMGITLFMLAWAGALFILAVAVLGILLVLLVSFGGKLIKKIDDIYGAIFHAVRSHFTFLVGFIATVIIITFLYSSLSGASPSFWLGFSQMLLGYVGISFGGGGGVSFPRYASEMQAPASWNDIIGKFYANGLLTNIVLLGVGLALILCLWKRKPHHILLFSALIILMGMVWPGKGQARFERVWWPFVPVMAGVGFATLLSWVRNLSLDPNWDWIKMFQRPLIVIAVLVFLSTPFIFNAYASAEAVTPPTEWHGRGIDAGFMEAFDWVEQNTEEDDIFSIQWSFGHLFTGATDRMTVVDGSEIKLEKGTWENDPSVVPRPPDYIYYVSDGRGYIYGVNVGGDEYAVNGRRPDTQWFPYSTENELKWYLKTYRDNFNVKIDYIIFSIDEISNAWNYYQYWEPGPILLGSRELGTAMGITQEGNNLQLNFGSGREKVVVDQSAQRVYLDTGGSQQDLDGYAVLTYSPQLIGGRRFDYSANFYSPSSTPVIDETVLIFTDRNGKITSAKLVEGVSNEVLNRETPISLRDVGGIDFLDEVFTSSNGYVKVYRVNHSVIV